MSQQNGAFEHTATTSPSPSTNRPMAHRIGSSAEAFDVAKSLAEKWAEGAAQRDRERLLPVDEVQEFSQTGLWAITVPQAYGGPGLPQTTLVEVVATLASADSSIAQIAQNHFELVELIRETGTEEQKRDLYELVIQGKRFGNAFSELSGRDADDFSTVIEDRGGNYVLIGEKFYCTGALYADYVHVIAHDPERRQVAAIVERSAPGLTVIDDWSAFGQRTTASGTVKLDNVPVRRDRVLPAYEGYAGGTPVGPVSQIYHVAIDIGLARQGFRQTVRLLRSHARPWIDSGVEKASQDPYAIQQVGDLAIRLHSAEALMRIAAEAIDAAIEDPQWPKVAKAKLATAEAKVVSTETALLAANKLFELGGTRTTLARHGLDRIWRDARVHTLHDPVRWKYHVIGNYYLNDVEPPSHAWI